MVPGRSGHLDHVIRASVLAGYVEVAHFVGIDPYPILKQAQIDARWLEDPNALLTGSAVARVLETSAKASGRDDFGILLAECRGLSSLGPIALLLEHEATVRDVVNAAVEFRPMLGDAVLFGLHDQGSTGFLRFEFATGLDSPQLASHVIAIACAILIDATEGAWGPTAAHFRHDAPQWVETYRSFFACPLHFNDSFNGLVYTAAAWDAKNRLAEPMLATYARHLLQHSPDASLSESVAGRVEYAIHLLLRHGSPTLGRVAAVVGSSQRSLQRMLASEGTTFEAILNKTRSSLATRYLLQSRKRISQIADETGFADSSSFERWFKAHFHSSPTRWRAEQRQDSRA